MMKLAGNNIMLDLETMGNDANSAIVAIGAVRFNTKITSRFYKVISLKSSIDAGLTMNADTVLWWLKQSDQSRAQFQEKGIDLIPGLQLFSNWIGKNPTVWGNGSDFDNTILKNAYSKAGLPLPWDYYNNRCYRTMKNVFSNIKMERTGVHHKAVDDAESQAEHLIRIYKTIKMESC